MCEPHAEHFRCVPINDTGAFQNSRSRSSRLIFASMRSPSVREYSWRMLGGCCGSASSVYRDQLTFASAHRYVVGPLLTSPMAALAASACDIEPLRPLILVPKFRARSGQRAVSLAAVRPQALCCRTRPQAGPALASTSSSRLRVGRRLQSQDPPQLKFPSSASMPSRDHASVLRVRPSPFPAHDFRAPFIHC